jgi:hypothetical protein
VAVAGADRVIAVDAIPERVSSWRSPSVPMMP